MQEYRHAAFGSGASESAVGTPAKTGSARTGSERKRGPSVTSYLLDDRSMNERIKSTLQLALL
jgi:hypothetical protein